MISKLQKLTILFVDDEPHFLMPLQRMFKRDYQLYTASSGQDALSIVRRYPIHIAVSDQTMPTMSGIDLLQNIKDLSPNTVRLLVIDKNDKAIAERALNEGLILHYVEKPWNNDELRAIIGMADEMAKLYWRDDQAAHVISSVERNRGILIFAEDVALCQLVYQLFGKTNMVYQAVDIDEAAAIVAKREIVLILVDTSHVGQQSIGALNILKKVAPSLLFIVLADQQDAKLVVSLSAHGGIFRCLTRPTKSGLLKLTINSALKYYEKRIAQAAADATSAAIGQEDESTTKAGGFADRMRSLWRH